MTPLITLITLPLSVYVCVFSRLDHEHSPRYMNSTKSHRPKRLSFVQKPSSRTLGSPVPIKRKSKPSSTQSSPGSERRRKPALSQLSAIPLEEEEEYYQQGDNHEENGYDDNDRDNNNNTQGQGQGQQGYGGNDDHGNHGNHGWDDAASASSQRSGSTKKSGGRASDRNNNPPTITPQLARLASPHRINTSEKAVSPGSKGKKFYPVSPSESPTHTEREKLVRLQVYQDAEMILAQCTPKLGLGIQVLRQQSEGKQLKSVEQKAVIADVSPGGAGDIAGLKAGDTVLQVNGLEIRNNVDFVKICRSFRPGARMSFLVLTYSGAVKRVVMTMQTKELGITDVAVLARIMNGKVQSSDNHTVTEIKSRLRKASNSGKKPAKNNGNGNVPTYMLPTNSALSRGKANTPTQPANDDWQ